MDSLIEQHGYNSKACEQVALDRSLGHIPASQCEEESYPSSLPTASVILIFSDEPLRLILRTVFSVINRSPPQYLKEVILVDDASKQADLYDPLDDFVDKTWPDKLVSIVRLPSRSGLMRARIAGARAATGDVLIFLDAHCEATSRWLEPLLARIHDHPKTVVCPAIANIDKFSLTFFRSDVRYTDDGYLSVRIGTFAWDGMFVFEHPQRSSVVERASQAEPIKSLTMAGGLFAINRQFFFDIGLYDEGMEVWGAENLELSFRIWQCYGRLEVSPCSTVGHVYRSNHPFSMPSGKDYNGHNTKRMAEVWMDEYKENLYLANGAYKSYDAGDLKDRKTLRKNLKCRSFQWLLDNVAPYKFVYTRNNTAYGSVCTSPQSCLSRPSSAPEYRKLTMPLQLSPRPTVSRWSHLFALTPTGMLRKDWACVRSLRKQLYFVWSDFLVDLETCPQTDPSEEDWWREWFSQQVNSIDQYRSTHPNSGWQAVSTTSRRHSNYRWAYDMVHGKLVNAETGLCLDKYDGIEPVPKPCEDGKLGQSWKIEHFK